MEHGDDGRSRDDVMDGPASPPDESGRILDPFRKAFAWARVRLNLSGELSAHRSVLSRGSSHPS